MEEPWESGDLCFSPGCTPNQLCVLDKALPCSVTQFLHLYSNNVSASWETLGALRMNEVVSDSVADVLWCPWGHLWPWLDSFPWLYYKEKDSLSLQLLQAVAISPGIPGSPTWSSLPPLVSSLETL